MPSAGLSGSRSEHSRETSEGGLSVLPALSLCYPSPHTDLDGKKLDGEQHVVLKLSLNAF
jgi:hypothetical protein